MDYRSAGVDVAAGRAFVDQISASVASTRRPEVVGGLGGFGGLCRLPAGLRNPLLVAGTDGVGTKLELAQAHGRHHDVGIDLVAMCVNDVVTSGAEPLFFLDYIATGKLSPEAMAAVVEGIADGCRQSGCALLGGETAEMPGFYAPGRYDLAGFCVAVVEADQLIDGSQIVAGDRIVAVASSGVHSNGFSLVRRILEATQASADTRLGPDGPPLVASLLKPTLLYSSLVKRLLSEGAAIRGMAHITGGGCPKICPAACPPGSMPSWMPPVGSAQPCSAGCRSTAPCRNPTSGTPSTLAWASAWWCPRLSSSACWRSAPWQATRPGHSGGWRRVPPQPAPPRVMQIHYWPDCRTEPLGQPGSTDP
jgi:phosphoribosylformylglycinamidine cyclo-ligase